jgi:hypothetical protein
MSIDVEYAIKKDIRNNPVVRGVDRDQKRDLVRSVCLAGLVVAMLLFSAWQQFKMVRHGYDLEDLREQLSAEEATGRALRLELEVARRPQEIDRRARRELRLSPPTAADTVVIERVRPSASAGAVLADVR